MEKAQINLKLPFFKVSANDPWRSSDFVKANFPTGCFIVDDDCCYFFMYHDGDGYLCEMTLNRDIVQESIVEDARHDEFMKSFNIIEEIENRLQQLARLAGECKDEVMKSETRIMDELSIQRDAEAHEFTLIMEGMKGLHDVMPKNGGSGVNLIDVAKTFAVIQKPELIEKL